MQHNELELFKATVQHQEHEHILFYAKYTQYVDEKLRKRFGLEGNEDLRDFFGMFNPVDVNLRPPSDLKQVDFSRYYSDISIPSNAFINSIGVLEIPGSIYHFTRYISPLRNAESIKDMEDFDFPNVDGYLDSHMKDEVEAAHKNNKVTSCSITHMYETAWQIRGYEEFLMDMVVKPENCEYILDKICERNIKKAEAAAKAGVDMLITGDDVANQKSMMFSPELWRKFIKPRWAKVYETAKSIKKDIQIWYHSDGNIEAIIPELIEIGVDILNPVQPECMDVMKIKKEYGKNIVIDGTIGTQTTMPFGTPADVRNLVKERKRTLGYDGALILSPTHVLEPDVPIENIIAFIEECAGISIL